MSRRRPKGFDEADLDRFDAFEREAWNTRGQHYAAAFADLTGGAIPALLDAVDEAATEAGGDLVDVGTGPGWVAAAARTRGWRVLGIDVSDTMLGLARARVPGAEFRRGSATDLGLPTHSVDAVVANFVLLHVARPADAVREAARVLRPGGRAAFTVWDIGAANRALGVFVDVATAVGFDAGPVPPGPDPLEYADTERFGALLRDGGLDDVRVERVEWTLRVGAEAWWQAVLAATPRTGMRFAGRPADALDRARVVYDDLVELYARGSTLALPAAALVAVGAAPR